MIAEDYCSYEVAKLLKEKGFNESCYTYYDDIDNSINRFDKGLRFNNTSYPWGVPYDISKAKKYIVTPTHQMAMRWLRETHDIDFDINTTGSRHVRRYYLAIWENKDEEMVTINPIGYFNKWEQACEAAIKYCLENLI